MSKYNTNLAAEYYVLSTLYRLGINAYLTLGNKKSVDIIIDRPGKDIITVDVNGLAGAYDWPADNYKEMSDRHYYILVTYEGKISYPAYSPSSWIIPAARIGDFIKQFKTRKDVSRSLVLENGEAYKENWEVLR